MIHLPQHADASMLGMIQAEDNVFVDFMFIGNIDKGTACRCNHHGHTDSW